MADKVKPDVLLKDFWRSNERFADLFNAVIFQGEEVMRPEELQEMDTDVSGIIQLKAHAESLMRKIFSDYKMNLVQVQDSGQYVFHNEDVRLVFELSREFFQGDLEKIKEKYKNQDIKQELLMVIGKIIDSSELMHWKQEGKVENVCTAVKKWEKEWYENGREEGRKSGITNMISAMRELGITQEVIVNKLCEKFGFTEEEAKQYM